MRNRIYGRPAMAAYFKFYEFFLGRQHAGAGKSINNAQNYIDFSCRMCRRGPAPSNEKQTAYCGGDGGVRGEWPAPVTGIGLLPRNLDLDRASMCMYSVKYIYPVALACHRAKAALPSTYAAQTSALARATSEVNNNK